jgi:quinol monooxygenase YgiN
MVRHIVLWRLKESANGQGKAENAADIKRRLEDLNGKIPGIIKFEVGFDFSRTPDSSDIVLYSEFESRAVLDAYQTHPLHEAVKPFIMAARDERRLVDYTILDQG